MDMFNECLTTPYQGKLLIFRWQQLEREEDDGWDEHWALPQLCRSLDSGVHAFLMNGKLEQDMPGKGPHRGREEVFGSKFSCSGPQ